MAPLATPKTTGNLRFYITNVGTGAALTASGTTVFSATFNNLITQQWQLHKASPNDWVIQSVSNGYYLVVNGAPGTGALQLSTTAFHWQVLPDTAYPKSFLIQKPSTSIVVTQVSPSGMDIQFLSSPPAVYQGWTFTLLDK